MGQRLRDRVIYDAPGLKNGMRRPVLVIEIGEDGDLIEHAAFDAEDEDVLETIANLPERIVASLQADDLADF